MIYEAMMTQSLSHHEEAHRYAHAVVVHEASCSRSRILGDLSAIARSRPRSLRPVLDVRRVNAKRNEVKEPEELESDWVALARIKREANCFAIVRGCGVGVVLHALLVFRVVARPLPVVHRLRVHQATSTNIDWFKFC